MKSTEISGNIWLAIIAGGRGTRLFPHSHDDCPKQFCVLDDTNTFIQATARRFIALGVKPNRSCHYELSPDSTGIRAAYTAQGDHAEYHRNRADVRLCGIDGKSG